jgi:4-hydroxy-4-methyl-2-oxoglutarate aldolase
VTGPVYRPGHEPVVPPRIGTAPDVDPIWFERFAEVSSCEIADAVGPLYVMDPGLVPLFRPIPRVVGRAVTVKAWPGDSLAVYGGLSTVRDGDVLVVDWRGHTGSCGGGAQILAEPTSRGMRGVVIDGAWRDAGDAADLGVPIYGRALNPYSPPKQRPGELNVAVSCGGVVVEPGDVVVADEEGIAVVPHRAIELVWDAVSGRARSPADESEVLRRAHTRAVLFHETFLAARGDDSSWSPEIPTVPDA